MKPEELIIKLNQLGYVVSVDGNTIRYQYRGEGDSPRKKVGPLLKALKIHKEQGWKPKEDRRIMVVEELPDEIKVTVSSEESLAFERQRKKVFKEAHEQLQEMLAERGVKPGTRCLLHKGGKDGQRKAV